MLECCFTMTVGHPNDLMAKYLTKLQPWKTIKARIKAFLGKNQAMGQRLTQTFE